MSEVRQVAWIQGPILRPVQERGRRERRGGSFEERPGSEEHGQSQEVLPAHPTGRSALGDEESGRHINVVG